MEEALQWLTWPETELLLDAINVLVWKPMVQFALHTGLRNGELRALQWRDIDRKNNRVAVRRTDYKGEVGSPKGKRIHRVPLNSAALEALASILRTGDLVFGQQPRGEMYTYWASLEAIKRYSKVAGLKGVGWHTLRHIFASQLVMPGQTSWPFSSTWDTLTSRRR